MHYAGPTSQPAYAVYAVLGRRPPYLGRSPIKRWEALTREIGAAGDARVVLSSESLCDADAAAISRIARDLGPELIHVVVTLRPIASILPSQWQQSVQGSLSRGYGPWLHTILDEPDSDLARSFWFRHRHDQLIERWAGVVGSGRVTAVVADDRDHEALLRVFEAFVGLRNGTLAPQRHRTNRSMTYPEVELLRVMNSAFNEAEIGALLRRDLVDRGVAAMAMRRSPRPGEPRIETPAWALERAARVAGLIVDGIRTSGVRVVGDLDRLLAMPARRRRDPETLDRTIVWPEVAVAAGMGVLFAAGASRTGRLRDADLTTISTDELRRIVRSRIRSAVATRLPVLISVLRSLRRLRRRLRRGIRRRFRTR